MKVIVHCGLGCHFFVCHFSIEASEGGFKDPFHVSIALQFFFLFFSQTMSLQCRSLPVCSIFGAFGEGWIHLSHRPYIIGGAKKTNVQLQQLFPEAGTSRSRK